MDDWWPYLNNIPCFGEYNVNNKQCLKMKRGIGKSKKDGQCDCQEKKKPQWFTKHYNQVCRMWKQFLFHTSHVSVIMTYVWNQHCVMPRFYITRILQMYITRYCGYEVGCFATLIISETKHKFCFKTWSPFHCNQRRCQVTSALLLCVGFIIKWHHWQFWYKVFIKISRFDIELKNILLLL